MSFILLELAFRIATTTTTSYQVVGVVVLDYLVGSPLLFVFRGEAVTTKFEIHQISSFFMPKLKILVYSAVLLD